MSSTVNGNGDRNIVITEAPVQINDIFCNDDIKSMHTKSENRNNLDSLTTNRQRSPTTRSIGSNNISIVTSDESENDSSVVDSDSNVDDVMNCNNYNETALVNKCVDPPNFCQSSILCTNNEAKSNIGSIAIQNSSDITFGNKTFYQAPVTINHYTYEKNKGREAKPSENDNIGYANRSSDNQSRNKMNRSSNFLYTIQKKFKCNKKRVLVSAISGGVLACFLLIIILVVILGGKDSSDLDIPVPSGPLKIVSRNDWNARPPEYELGKLHPPVARVIIAHTATMNCTTQEECSGLIRDIQTFHIDIKEFGDIGLNFLVGGDGAAYVGIGWDLEGAHTYGYNKNSICIAFIGNFIKIAPPKYQLYAAQKLIEEGVKMKKLIPDYRLYGHRQLIKTESPGLVLYEIIKKWDHWTEEIK